MRSFNVLVFICLYQFFSFPFCASFEPISSTIGTIVGGIILSASYAGYEYLKCQKSECCDDTWIKPNYTGMQTMMRESLHGQHLVEHIVVRSVKGFVENVNRKKALVMAFHGWTGSGKNYVCQLIANHLYYEGITSSYVHLYVATEHFPDADKVKQYREKLQNEIRHHTKRCGRSLFIFDELDKMPSGVFDALTPYMDYYAEVDGIDYRNNIFIFLSNAGGNEITKVAFDAWLNDRLRKSIKMKDIEHIISKGAFNEKGGLQNSEIIKRSLIDSYVPFLPMERDHVKMCIRDELRQRFKYVNEKVVTKVADQLEYYPTEFELYSSSGCKRISQKIDIYGYDDDNDETD